MTRVGVIGTGWGRMHVGAFRAAGAEVVALCGRDAAKTARIAAEEGIARATTDVAELVDAVEVVVVAGPDATHPAHVARALAAGRHVLCEKPLALTRADVCGDPPWPRALARFDDGLAVQRVLGAARDASADGVRRTVGA